MFQQGGKFYLNASNWIRCQRFNYINNNKDRYQDIGKPIQKISEFPYHLNTLSRLKTGTKHSQKTGLIKTSSLYSVSSVRERLANEAGTNTGIDIHTLKEKMANTLSVMTNVLRNVVSKQRIRYKEKGFNLDLAYVCDNIIAMGYPADNYESMYRNPLADVYKFLEDNHHDHYKIYNLCLERSYDITKFHGRVSVYPFEDHNPPTIELILRFCEDVDNWLKADVLNVAAVHCKAGKGRTGTMICCYLLYSGQQLTAEDALACYDEKRTKDRKGVTIPSQRRYVQYFSKLMRLGLPYKRRTLQFCEIRFSKATTLYSQGTVHCSICVLQDKVQQLQNFPIDFRKNSVLDIKNPSLSVSGDIKVELTKNTKKIFHFWFNTFFVTDSSVIEGEGNDVKFVYTLQKCEIDDVHKDKCYPDDFKVELVFYIDDNSVDTDQLNVSTGNRVSSNNRPTVQDDGMLQTSSQHQHQHQHQQQSNNYSLPPNNSSGSEINLICDQKSSSSTSVSSSFGVSGTDSSNGYESSKSTMQRTSGVVPPNLCNHHSNHYLSATDVVNNSIVYTASPPPQHMTVPPNYLEHHQQHQPQQYHHHQQQQHKKNINEHKQHHLIEQQQENSGGLQMTTTAIQRHHFHRSINDGGDVVAVDGVVVHDNNSSNNMETTCQPSANLNDNPTSKNFSSSGTSNNVTSAVSSSNSYNHNLSNSSSKTNSVSSQSSSSAIGDNEEDWESANSTTITQNNTQQQNVEVTNINILNISSVDVIKENNKLNYTILECGSNAATIETAKSLTATTLNETQYNQQRHKQMKHHHPQQQQQQQHQQKQEQKQQLTQQKLCNGLTNRELTTTTANKIKNNNKTSTVNTNTIASINNTTANTNTTPTTSQQLCHSCLQTGDLSSELKCC